MKRTTSASLGASGDRTRFDPVLMSHKVGALKFELSSDYDPLSIRDQMLRAERIIVRAWEAHLIGHGDVGVRSHRQLLIIGAGVSGATAAVRAAQLGVKCLVIDRAKGSFERFAACTTREVQPTLYDWPWPHCGKSIYPWTGRRAPFSFAADKPNMLATLWRWEFSRACATLKIRVEYNTRLRRLVDLPGRIRKWTRSGKAPLVRAYLSREGKSLDPEEFGMVLFCTGFHNERCSVGTYEGFRFWQSDPFDLQQLALESEPCVLISGAGDGAIQDFLRIVSRGSSAASLLKTVEAFSDAAALNSLKLRIQFAEDQAQRAYIWAARPSHDHIVQQCLHREYEAAVDELLEKSGRSLTDALDKEMINWRIDLVHACDHFTRCYPLNRFLALLFIRRLQAVAPESFKYRPRLRVREIHCEGHAPPVSPRTGEVARDYRAAFCHGKDHVAYFTEAPDCVVHDNPVYDERGRYNVVIVRHGVSVGKWGPSTIFYPRQLLPYYL